MTGLLPWDTLQRMRNEALITEYLRYCRRDVHGNQCAIYKINSVTTEDHEVHSTHYATEVAAIIAPLMKGTCSNRGVKQYKGK